MSGKHRITPDEAARSHSRPPLPFPVSDGRVSPVAHMEMARRKQRRRTRLAAGFTASVMAMGGAAGMSFAMADETPESGSSEVVFSGSCGLLNTVASNSSPNVDELSVSSGTTVDFTNDTGSDAELMLGDSSYAVGEGASRAFEMNQSAEIAMIPDCGLLLSDYGTATVSVTQDDPPSDNDSDSSSDSGSSDSSDTDPHELPSTNSSDEGSSDDSEPAAGADSADAAPEDEGAPGIGGDSPDATEDEDSPGLDEDALEDEAEEEESSLPFPPTDRDDDEDSITTAGDVQAVDREQLQDGASGLLALLAIVCLVGVGAAAVRTMMVQRTPVT